jgi:cytochrome bd-type quinol oxidase subunit 2
MLNRFNKHRIVFIIIIIDLLLFWLLFHSGIVLPFINPSVEEYRILVEQGTSFPRHTNQCFLWMHLQIPIVLCLFVYTLKCFLSKRVQ